jgi:hypothetical protein
MSIDFKKHLHRQLTFMRLSCESYDAGHTDESIRIATVIRVLVNDTKNSTSLLKHLGAQGINLSTTVLSSPAPGTVLFSGMGRLKLAAGPAATGGRWGASTDPDSIKAQLPASAWWAQIVYIAGKTKLSRKDLVLSAADKDGGAHVDAKLTPGYEALMHSGERGLFYYPTKGENENFQPIMNAHLVYLRQMGHELLNSPELLKLAS